MADSTHEVTRLLGEMKRGNDAARDALWALVYDELRRLAGGYMRDQAPGHTLQATALVHDAYVRLVDANVAGASRKEFFALAARAMRNLLVDHARGRARIKRGGDVVKVTLDEGLLPENAAPDRLLDLDAALTEFAALDRRKADVVELHHFGGLTYEEIGEHLGVSLSTVRADMRFARAWLAARLGGTDPSPS